ncbi:DNA-binding response regulator [Bifidobacterium sp. DSM 109957]|uniref:DNA-binding response regulator n=2 Tax=Bifidobacterium oedipodis TaxID=2675322 RepID=A0A7Y0EQR5_9BIFI|nr:DNA-binding response regulator [Bifidobacterium sp. DSM 109957]
MDSLDNGADGFQPLRLAIVDNDPLTVKLLAQAVPRWVPGVQVMWYTQSGGDAARKCTNPELAPDILMLDMSLNDGESGLDVCRLIRSDTDKVPVLGITSFSLTYYAAKLAAAGAQGLATKSDSSMMSLAISRLRRGGTFSPVSGVQFETTEEAHRRIISEPASTRPKLSAQEARILDLLSQGRKYAQIAEEFGVTESSIRTQSHRAVKKLNANTLSQAIAIWVTGTWQ